MGKHLQSVCDPVVAGFPHDGRLHLSGPSRCLAPAQRTDSQSRKNLREAGRMGARQFQGREKDRSCLRFTGCAVNALSAIEKEALPHLRDRGACMKPCEGNR
jgi:hypothetical protein